MNATHVRPLVAFWVLAATAALITTVGLTEDSSPARLGTAATTSSARPAEVASGAAEPSEPARTAVGNLLVPRSSWSSAAAVEHGAAGVSTPIVAAPESIAALPTTEVDAPGEAGSDDSSTGSDGSGTATIAARPTTTATGESDPGQGDGRAKARDKANGHAHVPGPGHGGKGRGH